jgi:hypothetical protein
MTKEGFCIHRMDGMDRKRRRCALFFLYFWGIKIKGGLLKFLQVVPDTRRTPLESDPAVPRRRDFTSRQTATAVSADTTLGVSTAAIFRMAGTSKTMNGNSWMS